MNLLTDALPCTIIADGREIPVHTDFRRWILVTEVFGESLPSARKLALCAKLVLCEEGVPLTEELAEAMACFALCGDMPSESHGNTEPLFDFTQDSEAIFAGFLQVYGVDLTAAHLHWWKFMAMLRNLPPDCGFMRLVELRGTDITRIEDDALRKRLRRAKARVRVSRK